MTLSSAIHDLEQQIVQFKTSQDIGSSSARSIPVTVVSASGTTGYVYQYVIGVFTAKDIINPLIMPRLTVTVGGSTPSVSQAGLFYDDSYILFLLQSNNLISTNIFDEYTTAFGLGIYEYSTSFSVSGTVYATCEGTLKLYNFADTGGY